MPGWCQRPPPKDYFINPFRPRPDYSSVSAIDQNLWVLWLLLTTRAPPSTGRVRRFHSATSFRDNPRCACASIERQFRYFGTGLPR